MKQHIHGGDVYRYPDVLDFSANINPLGTPPEVIEAAAESLNQIRNYPDVRQERLICALSRYEQVPEHYIICGNGAADLIFSLVWTIRPKKALLVAPTFAEYGQALSASGCRIEYYYLKEQNGFCMEDGFVESVTEDLDIVFLCNPNNPTGIPAERDFLEKLIEKCSACRVRLVLDECFVDFLDHPGLATMKEKLPDYPEVFLLKAFTKRYAMAGLRLGYGICSDKKLLENIRQSVQPWNISIPAQEAGVAALKEEAYVRYARQIVSQERKWMKSVFKELGLTVYDSQANYIFFRGPENLSRTVLKYGVMIRDCSNYPGLEKGYYRTAVRLHPENIKLADALRAALSELKNKE